MKPEESLGKMLTRKRLTLAVAESCTGGMVSDKITDISGASKYFMMGVITYSNESKIRLLGMPKKAISKYGAVSSQVASKMAESVRSLASADIGIGITGIAGPTGGTKKKPVGLVYIALAMGNDTIVKEFRFKGLREQIKHQASQAALKLCAYSLL